jgi:hypothetical protein
MRIEPLFCLCKSGDNLNEVVGRLGLFNMSLNGLVGLELLEDSDNRLIKL